jgi:hypothetical protein
MVTPPGATPTPVLLLLLRIVLVPSAASPVPSSARRWPSFSFQCPPVPSSARRCPSFSLQCPPLPAGAPPFPSSALQCPPVPAAAPPSLSSALLCLPVPLLFPPVPSCARCCPSFSLQCPPLPAGGPPFPSWCFTSCCPWSWWCSSPGSPAKATSNSRGYHSQKGATSSSNGCTCSHKEDAVAAEGPDAVGCCC